MLETWPQSRVEKGGEWIEGASSRNTSFVGTIRSSLDCMPFPGTEEQERHRPVERLAGPLKFCVWREDPFSEREADVVARRRGDGEIYKQK